MPSGQAGKYWISCATQPYNTSSVANGSQIVPYLNGSSMGNTYNASQYQISNFRNHWIMWSGMINLSAGDYLEDLKFQNNNIKEDKLWQIYQLKSREKHGHC